MKYFIWVLLIVVIIFRYFSTRPVYKNGDTIRLTATVFSDPVTYGDYQVISAAGIKIYLPNFPEISYGDRVTVEGLVDNGKLNKAKLINVENFQGFGSGFRKRIISFYEKVLPQPIAGLTAGIILGSKGALSLDFWEKVKNTGVAHVVVASGTNVTFVISFIFAIVSIYLPRRKSIYIVILSIVLYLFVSGFQPPLIRAAIMSSLTFLVQERGRLVNAWKVLFLTAGIMLVITPVWITDIGFILSFVSTAAIMLFAKRINLWLKNVPEVLREGLSTSLAAQIGVAPILYVTFGQFNILSPLINALVLWTIPYIMVLGALGGVVGLVIPTLGKIILYIMYPLGWWFSQIVLLFGK